VNTRDAFAVAYRAVRLSHPHGGPKGGHGRQVHPLHVDSLVYAAASAVAGKRLEPDARLLINSDYPLEHLQRAHRSVQNVYRWKTELANGSLVHKSAVEERLRWIRDAQNDAWGKVAFLRHKRGFDDLWNIRFEVRGDVGLLRRAWAETRAGIEGQARTAIRFLKQSPTLTAEQAITLAGGLSP
jgi:hypothetical protein